jgi:hypothetical protein
MVSIPDYINQLASIMDLTSHIYLLDLLSRAAIDPLVFRKRCLLTTLNIIVVELNRLIIGRLLGQLRTYRSIDSLNIDKTLDGSLHKLPIEQL